MRQRLLILGVAMLAGCAANTPEAPPAPQAPAINDKPARVSRELTVAWDNYGRGGAALRQPAFVHVLGQDGSLTSNIASTTSETISLPAPILTPGDIAATMTAFKGIQSGNRQGYSIYEISRWERYCNAGKGMDEHDWRFIDAQGTTNVPSEVITGCIPPVHTSHGYLQAWTHFCTNQGVTPDDRRIVRESVRPYSVVNPCKALK